MSLEANLADLRSHADDFTAGREFTFPVPDPADGTVIGCAYLYPPESDGDASVRSWVRADRSHLDQPLADAIANWITAEWPWQQLERFGR